MGKDGTKDFNVRSIAIQLPSNGVRGGANTDATKSDAVIGVWAKRQRSTIRNRSRRR